MHPRTRIVVFAITLAAASACTDDSGPTPPGSTTQGQALSDETSGGTSNVTSTTSPIRVQSDLTVGDCVVETVDDSGTITVTVTECTAVVPRVVALVSLPDAPDEYPGEDALLTRADSECTAQSGPISGSLGHIIPTAEIWAEGKRQITCLDVPATADG